MIDYIFYFAITIGVLVFVHEFGHFAAAKLSGMRADIFAIGYGKRLFGWNKLTGFSFGDLPKDFDGKGNTDYRLCLLPLGGYVKIAGMVDESFDTEFADKEPEPYEFRAQPTWKKVIVITAGVFMNLLLTFLVFWAMNFFKGHQITNTTTVGYVVQNSIADSLGFKANDKIISINDNPVENWEDVRTNIFISHLGENLIFKVQRENKVLEITAGRSRIPSDESTEMFLIPSGAKLATGDVLENTPAFKAGLKPNDFILAVNNTPVFTRAEAVKIFESHKNQEIPLIVFRGKDTLNLSVTPGSDGKIGAFINMVYTGNVEYKTYGFFESIYYSVTDIARVSKLTVQMVGRVFTGKLEFGKAFGGPIKIAQFAAKSADNGFASFLYFLALLSLSLALINIFPFPVLDGGHLVIILIEGAIKREIPIKVKIAIQNVGFVLLLLLMAFIIYSDIINL